MSLGSFVARRVASRRIALQLELLLLLLILHFFVVVVCRRLVAIAVVAVAAQLVNCRFLITLVVLCVCVWNRRRGNAKDERKITVLLYCVAYADTTRPIIFNTRSSTFGSAAVIVPVVSYELY